MGVEINIDKQNYEFIDGATGGKISKEDFAKKYPRVGIARLAGNSGTQETGKGGEGNS